MQEPTTPPDDLVWVKRWVALLDDAVRVPGTSLRFGLDPILGLILPGAGDALSAVGSVALLVVALRRRVPTATLWRMLLNILLDAALGAVPLLGDFFDFQWKANRRNLELIQRHSQAYGIEPRARASVSDYLVVGLAVACVVALVALCAVLGALLLKGFYAALPRL